MTTRTYGPEYSEKLDGKRVVKQHEVIRDYMLGSGNWKSLTEISLALDYPEASVSAQLRHLRKIQFGGYTVEKRRRAEDGGTWEYKVSPPKTSRRSRPGFLFNP